jgi:outer membrane protein assembly factor BamA
MPLLAALLTAAILQVAQAPEASASLQITDPDISDGDAQDGDSGWKLGIVPLPLLYFGASLELPRTEGPIDQYAKFSGAFSWFGKEVYDPRSTSRSALSGYSSPGTFSPGFEAKGAYGLNVVDGARLFLQGRYLATNIEPNGSSWLAKEPPGFPNGLETPVDADALVSHRPIVTIGPHLDVDFVDDVDFPTSGTQVRLAADFGPSWAGNQTKSGRANDFALYRGRISEFLPFGDDMTLVLSGVAGYGTGVIPTVMRYSAGGADLVRGYLGDRFSGNQLVAGTLEWRHLVLPGLIEVGDLGFSYHIFADYGRVWEASCTLCSAANAAIAFPNDLRAGIGAGIGIVTGRSTLLQLDVMAGNEGLVNYPLFGGALKLPVVPVFGLSLSESW